MAVVTVGLPVLILVAEVVTAVMPFENLRSLAWILLFAAGSGDRWVVEDVVGMFAGGAAVIKSAEMFLLDRAQLVPESMGMCSIPQPRLPKIDPRRAIASGLATAKLSRRKEGPGM